MVTCVRRRPAPGIMSYALMGTFASGSSWQARRSGRLRSGVLVAPAVRGAPSDVGSPGEEGTLGRPIQHPPRPARARMGTGGIRRTPPPVPAAHASLRRRLNDTVEAERGANLGACRL